MQRYLAPLVLVILTAVLGGLYWQSQQQRAADAEAFAAERQDLRERLWAAEQRANELEQQLNSRVTVAPTAGGNATGAATGASGNARGGRAGLAAMVGSVLSALDQSSLQGLIGMQQRSQLDASYGDLFRSLNLSPQQLEQLKLLLVDRQSAGLDVLNAAQSQGLDGLREPGALVGLVAETQAGIDGEIRQLLGDSGFATYESYQQTLPQRTVVNQLAERLSYTSAPLSDTQKEQLVTIFAADAGSTGGGLRGVAADVSAQTSPVLIGGMTAGGARMIATTAGGGLLTEGAVAQSQGVLSPPQYEALQQLQREQQQQLEMTRSLRSSLPLGGSN